MAHLFQLLAPESTLTSKYSLAYQTAFDWIVSAEGGYSNDPADKGGETLCGLSRRAYPNVDFSKLTLSEIARMYHRDYWRACQCEKLPQVIAIALFDGAVNHGPKLAVEMLQRVIKTKPDGIIGPKTLAQVNQHNQGELLSLYLGRRARKYARIAINDSSQSRFLLGWMNRVTKLQLAIHQAVIRYKWQDSFVGAA